MLLVLNSKLLPTLSPNILIPDFEEITLVCNPRLQSDQIKPKNFLWIVAFPKVLTTIL